MEGTTNGPRTWEGDEAEYPCNICKKDCEWGQHSILCDSCEQWIHRKCGGYTIFDYYELANCDEQWICPLCVEKRARRGKVAHKRNNNNLINSKPAPKRSDGKTRFQRKWRNNDIVAEQVLEDMITADKDQEGTSPASLLDNPAVTSSAWSAGSVSSHSAQVSSQQSEALAASSQSSVPVDLSTEPTTSTGVSSKSGNSAHGSSKPADGKRLGKKKRQNEQEVGGDTVLAKKRARIKRKADSGRKPGEEKEGAKKKSAPEDKDSGKMSVWSELGVFKCDSCGFTTSEEAIFQCHICGRRRSTQKSLLNPSKSHVTCSETSSIDTSSTFVLGSVGSLGSSVSITRSAEAGSTPLPGTNRSAPNPKQKRAAYQLSTPNTGQPLVALSESADQSSMSDTVQPRAALPVSLSDSADQSTSEMGLPGAALPVSQSAVQSNQSSTPETGLPRAALPVLSQCADQSNESSTSKTDQPRDALPVSSSRSADQSNESSTSKTDQPRDALPVSSSRSADQSNESSTSKTDQPRDALPVSSSRSADQSNESSTSKTDQPRDALPVSSSRSADQSNESSTSKTDQPRDALPVSSSRSADQSNESSTSKTDQPRDALPVSSSRSADQSNQSSTSKTDQPRDALPVSSSRSADQSNESSTSKTDQPRDALPVSSSRSADQSNPQYVGKREQKYGYIQFDESIQMFVCLQCQYRAVRGNGLFEHLIYQTSVDPYNCALCKQGFPTRPAFQIHFGANHPGKKIECELHNVKEMKKLLERAKDAAKSGKTQAFLLHANFSCCIVHSTPPASSSTTSQVPVSNASLSHESKPQGATASVSSVTPGISAIAEAESSARNSPEHRNDHRNSCELVQNSSSRSVSGNGLNTSVDATSRLLDSRLDSGDQESSRNAVVTSNQCSESFRKDGVSTCEGNSVEHGNSCESVLIAANTMERHAAETESPSVDLPAVASGSVSGAGVGHTAVLCSEVVSSVNTPLVSVTPVCCSPTNTTINMETGESVTASQAVGIPVANSPVLSAAKVTDPSTGNPVAVDYHSSVGISANNVLAVDSGIFPVHSQTNPTIPRAAEASRSPFMSVVSSGMNAVTEPEQPVEKDLSDEDSRSSTLPEWMNGNVCHSNSSSVAAYFSPQVENNPHASSVRYSCVSGFETGMSCAHSNQHSEARVKLLERLLNHKDATSIGGSMQQNLLSAQFSPISQSSTHVNVSERDQGMRYIVPAPRTACGIGRVVDPQQTDSVSSLRMTELGTNNNAHQPYSSISSVSYRSPIYSPISPPSPVPNSPTQAYFPISPPPGHLPAAAAVDSAHAVDLSVPQQPGQPDVVTQANQESAGRERSTVSSLPVSGLVSSLALQPRAVSSTDSNRKPALAPNAVPVTLETGEIGTHSLPSVPLDGPAVSQALPSGSLSSSFSSYFVKFHDGYACFPCSERFKGIKGRDTFYDHVWSHLHPEKQECNECSSSIVERDCVKTREMVESVSSTVDRTLLLKLTDDCRKKFSSKLVGRESSPSHSVERQAESPDSATCPAQPSSRGPASEVQASENVQSDLSDGQHESEVPSTASCPTADAPRTETDQREGELTVTDCAEQTPTPRQSLFPHWLSPARESRAEETARVTGELIAADQADDEESGTGQPDQLDQGVLPSSSSHPSERAENVPNSGQESGGYDPDTDHLGGDEETETQPEGDADLEDHDDQSSSPNIDQNVEEEPEEQMPSGIARTTSMDCEPSRANSPDSRVEMLGPAGSDACNRSSAFYICSLCDFNCVTAIDFTMHLTFNHDDETSFPCYHCNYQGKYNTDLTNHMNDHTSAREANICPCFLDGCVYRTDILNNMSQHLGKHQDCHTFQCYTCKSIFTDSEEFLQHARQNLIILYTCTLCGFRFVEKAAIKQHLRTKHLSGKVYRVAKVLVCCERKENGYYQSSTYKMTKNKVSQNSCHDSARLPALPVSDTENTSYVPAADTEKTAMPDTEKTSMPDTEKTTSVPVPDTEKTTSVPDTEKTTSVPVPDTEKTTSVPVPNTEKTTSVPDTEKTTSVPDTEKTTSVPVPDTEKTTSVPVPDTEKTTSVPDTEKTTSVPVPDTENTTSVPDTEKTTSVPDTEKTTSVPDTEKTTSVPVPDTEKTTSVPVPDTEKTTSVPVPDTEKTTSVPASDTEKTTCVPASDTEKTTCVPDTEKTCVPDTEKTTSVPASDTEKTTSVPDTEKTSMPDIEKTSVPDTEKATCVPASDTEKTASVPVPDTEKTTSVPDTEKTSVPDAEKTTCVPASDTEKTSVPVPDAEKTTCVPDTEKTSVPDAEKTTCVPDTEKTSVPDAEKTTCVPDTEKTSVPDAEKTTCVPASDTEKTTCVPASDTEKTTCVPASDTEKTTCVPASDTEKTTCVPASDTEKTTCVPASDTEKTNCVPASDTENTCEKLADVTNVVESVSEDQVWDARCPSDSLFPARDSSEPALDILSKVHAVEEGQEDSSSQEASEDGAVGNMQKACSGSSPQSLENSQDPSSVPAQNEPSLMSVSLDEIPPKNEDRLVGSAIADGVETRPSLPQCELENEDGSSEQTRNQSKDLGRSEDLLSPATHLTINVDCSAERKDRDECQGDQHPLEENPSSDQDRNPICMTSVLADTVPSDCGDAAVLENQVESTVDEPSEHIVQTVVMPSVLPDNGNETSERDASCTATDAVEVPVGMIPLADLCGSDELHSALSAHLYHRSAGKFCCAICGKSFSRLERIHEHLFTHFRVPLFSCSLCDYECGLSREIKRHVVDEHERGQKNCLLVCRDQLLASLEQERPLTVQSFRTICHDLIEGDLMEGNENTNDRLENNVTNNVRDESTDAVVTVSSNEQETSAASGAVVSQLSNTPANCGVKSFNRSALAPQRSVEGESPGGSGEAGYSPVKDGRKVRAVAAKPHSSVQYMPKTAQKKSEAKVEPAQRGTYTSVKVGSIIKLKCKACNAMTCTPNAMSIHLRTCQPYINRVSVSEETDCAASLARLMRANDSDFTLPDVASSSDFTLPLMEASSVQSKETGVGQSENLSELSSDYMGSGSQLEHSVHPGKSRKRVSERSHCSDKKAQELSSKDVRKVERACSPQPKKSRQSEEFHETAVKETGGAKIFGETVLSASNKTKKRDNMEDGVENEAKTSEETKVVKGDQSSAEIGDICDNSADSQDSIEISDEDDVLLQRKRKRTVRRLDSSSEEEDSRENIDSEIDVDLDKEGGILTVQEQILQCKYCEFSAPSSHIDRLQEHVHTKHQHVMSLIKCGHCGQLYGSSKILKNHIKSVHPGKPELLEQVPYQDFFKIQEKENCSPKQQLQQVGKARSKPRLKQRKVQKDCESVTVLEDDSKLEKSLSDCVIVLEDDSEKENSVSEPVIVIDDADTNSGIVTHPGTPNKESPEMTLDVCGNASNLPQINSTAKKPSKQSRTMTPSSLQKQNVTEAESRTYREEEKHANAKKFPMLDSEEFRTFLTTDTPRNIVSSGTKNSCETRSDRCSEAAPSASERAEPVEPEVSVTQDPVSASKLKTKEGSERELGRSDDDNNETTSKRYRCVKCQQPQPDYRSIFLHLSRHLNYSLPCCSVCQMELVTSEVQRHYSKKHPGKPVSQASWVQDPVKEQQLDALIRASEVKGSDCGQQIIKENPSAKENLNAKQFRQSIQCTSCQMVVDTLSQFKTHCLNDHGITNDSKKMKWQDVSSQNLYDLDGTPVSHVRPCRFSLLKHLCGLCPWRFSSRQAVLEHSKQKHSEVRWTVVLRPDGPILPAQVAQRPVAATTSQEKPSQMPGCATSSDCARDGPQISSLSDDVPDDSGKQKNGGVVDSRKEKKFSCAKLNSKASIVLKDFLTARRIPEFRTLLDSSGVTSVHLGGLSAEAKAVLMQFDPNSQ